MMYGKRRKIYNLGGVRAVPLPDGTPVGAMASVAMDKLVLIDPMGLLEPAELLGLIEKLEPDLWRRSVREPEDPK